MTIGETRIIRRGDGYFHVTPEVVHGIRCIEPGMLVDVFSPPAAKIFFLTSSHATDFAPGLGAARILPRPS